MSKGKFAKGGISIKAVALALTVVLLIGGTVGGTLAWLLAASDPVVNTFTTSDINIELTETKKDFKMVPGWTIDKDPKVIVKADSEDCYVFLTVEETNGKGTVVKSDGKSENVTYEFDTLIDYDIDGVVDGVDQENGNWTKLKDKDGKVVDGVYYCIARDIKADRTIKVLAGGEVEINDVTYSWGPEQVLVLPTVTKEMMNALEADGAVLPALTFKAYAVQLNKSNETPFKPWEAWANALNLQAEG